ncbi:MAG: hypothetical protein KJ559_00955, partial [Nanoarchaeota archaeon]|nr:hypothetical protein [Nanoarchaeota archaeon]
MRNKTQTLFSITIFSFILINLVLVSSEIMFSQPEYIYNLGDQLNTTLTLNQNQDSSGFFEIYLECDSISKNFYRNPFTLAAHEEKIIETSFLLTKSFLGTNYGDCNIQARYNDEVEVSQKFVISDKIEVSLSLDSLEVEPGKEIEIRGDAVKENGKSVEGFLELWIEGTEISITRGVSNGSFSADFMFPKNTKSGDYVLKAKVYEKYNEDRTNQGETKAELRVKQIPKEINITLNKKTIKPEENLNIEAKIYDQAGEIVSGNIGLKIYDENEELIYEKIIKSGEEEVFFIKSNSIPGFYRIQTESLGLESSKSFYVEEFEKVRFDITNNTLTITNVGNVIYRKPIQVSIGGHSEIKNIDLDIGEVIKLGLSAPDGNYSVQINDGDSELELGSVALTGNVIGVNELKKSAGLITKYPIIWLFLVSVCGLFVIMTFRKTRKKKFYEYSPAESSFVPRLKKSDERPQKERVLETGIIKEAVHDLVLDGKKENVAVIAVRLEDIGKISEYKKETLEKIKETIQENRGVIYQTPRYYIIIFSSLTTKTFGNKMTGVRVAKQIEILLKEYNKKFKEKINYGISVNSGELVLKKEQNKIKFTSIGNTLNLSKKIAEMSNQEVLMSERIHKELISGVKAEKENRNGIDVYHINQIIEKQKNNEFIRDFLKRQENSD